MGSPRLLLVRRTRWGGFWLAALPATNLLAVVPLPMLAVTITALAPMAFLTAIRRPLPKAFVAPMLAAAVLLPATIWTPEAGKAGAALVWTLLPLTLPIILVRTRRGVERHLYGVVAVAVAVVVVSPTWGDGRLAPRVGNIIELGRIAALGVLVSAVLAIVQGKPKLLLAAAPCAYVALATGSRGPLVGLLVAGAYLALGVRLRRRRRHRAVRIASMVVLIASVAAAWSSAPDESLDRFSFVHDRNSELRSRMFDEAVSLSMRTPGGLGWGQFGEAVDWLHDDAYPHNMLLEIWVEGGLVAGLGMVLLIAWPLVGLWRSRDPLGRLVGATLAYWLIAASFSGSFFFNRGLFLALGVAWATNRIVRHPGTGSGSAMRNDRSASSTSTLAYSAT